MKPIDKIRDFIRKLIGAVNEEHDRMLAGVPVDEPTEGEKMLDRLEIEGGCFGLPKNGVQCNKSLPEECAIPGDAFGRRIEVVASGGATRIAVTVNGTTFVRDHKPSGDA